MKGMSDFAEYVDKGMMPAFILGLGGVIYLLIVSLAIEDGYSTEVAVVFPLLLVGVTVGLVGGTLLLLALLGYLRTDFRDDLRRWRGRE